MKTRVQKFSSDLNIVSDGGNTTSKSAPDLQNSSKQLLPQKKKKIVTINPENEEIVTDFEIKLPSITSNSITDYKESDMPLVCEPLDEEGEKYLQEHIGLPPIDMTTMPTEYYINLHPTESIMSSSLNSANEWWENVDYSDDEDLEVECACSFRKKVRLRTSVTKPEEETGKEETALVTKSFPKTLEMQNQWKVKKVQKEEEERGEIISKLEKQMISLYNLKKQYKRTLGGQGCRRVRTTLPPLVADDTLTRQRDLLLSRIRRKKVEEEITRRKQLERKLNIVRSLLNEQKQKEREIRWKSKEKEANKHIKPKAKREEISELVSEKSIDDVVQSGELIEEAVIADEDIQNEIDLVQTAVDDQGAVSPTSDDQQQIEALVESPRKSSAGNKGRKKKSLEKSAKKGGKAENKKKKQIKVEAEEPPAICEEPPELPATQMAELSLWFDNWREHIKEEERRLKELEEQQLPLENEVVVKPNKLVFKNVMPGQRIQQQLVVTNIGQEALKCRVLGVSQHTVTEKTPRFRTGLSGPSKARTGHFWTLTVTMDTADAVEDGSAEVLVQFCRKETIRSRLTIEVQVLTPRAEPVFNTSTIRFGPQVFWTVGHITKRLEISNPGGLACVVSWTELDQLQQRPTVRMTSSTVTTSGTNQDSIDQELQSQELKMKTDIAEEIVETAFDNVFKAFRIDASAPLLLPAKSHITLPVRFVPTMTEDRGDVFTKFRFTFEGGNVENETQDLVVCGKIERLPFRLFPEIVDMRLCYVGGGVQQARINVVSHARHACSVVARVPRSLASVVSIVPRVTMVQPGSATQLAVRIVLGWDFFNTPAVRYLEGHSELFMFPVAVSVRDVASSGAPPLVATVISLVAPPCPLSLEPSLLDLGTVSTMETVVADLRMTNHTPHTYHYAFAELPESVMIEPGGGSGSILPLETVNLQMFFSPRAKDLGVICERPGGEGEVSLNLKCFTTVSLASSSDRKKAQKSEQLLNAASGISSKYIVNTNTSILASSTASVRGSLEEKTGRKAADESKNRVTFDELISENILDESSVYIKADNGLDVEEDFEEDYVTIEEMNKEESEFEEEDLWDFYSDFRFLHTGSIYEKHMSRGDGVNYNMKDIGEKETSKSLRSASLSNKDEHDNVADAKKRAQSLKEGEAEGEALEKTSNKGEGRLASGDYIKESDNEREHNTAENYGIVEEADLDDHWESETGNTHGERSSTVIQLPVPYQRCASVSVKANVVDPLIELSSQRVILPPTPCTSYSIAHLHVRSRLQKSCGIHEKNKAFKTDFKFHSPSEDLIVEPKHGQVSFKQRQKVTLIFKPTLSKEEIFGKALEMKVENLKRQKIQEMLDEYYKSKEKNQPKRSGDGSSKKKSSVKEVKLEEMSAGGKSKKGKGQKKSKGSIVTVATKKTKKSLKSLKLPKKSSGALPDVVIDLAEVEVTEEDLRDAEMWLLKYLEPFTQTTTLSCLLDTDFGDGNRRKETLRCEVVCPITAPKIFLTCPSCLNFGPVAVGARPRLEATITNISFFDALLRLSTLNPVGPFMCPAHLEFPFWKNGEMELPPEHTLTIPLWFQPSESGKVVEAFEVVSGTTVLALQARGEGVLPSFSFQPDREVFMFTSGGGKKADVIISISNTCEAPLRFQVVQEYLREGQSLPTPKPDSPVSEVSSHKQKGQPKKEKKPKGLPEFTMLTQELVSSLDDEFHDVDHSSLTEPVFKILDIDGGFTVSAGETKQLLVRFTPPSSKPDMNLEAKSPKSAKGSLKEDSNAKGKKMSTNKKPDKQETSTNKSTIYEKPGKKKGSKSEKGGKKKDLTSEKSSEKGSLKRKTIFAGKFSVFLADIQKVTDWVFLGTKK